MRSFSALLILSLSLTLAFLSGRALQEPPQDVTKIQAEIPKPLNIPEEERNRINPVAPDPVSVDQGQKLFSSQCAMCHGKEGDGTGDLAGILNLPIPNFKEKDDPPRRTDGELYYIVTQGHGQMPGQADRLRPKQKWHLINFIRSLSCKKDCEPAG